MPSDDYVVDSDENSDYIVNNITKIINEAGPRLPGSEGEKKAAEIYAKDLEEYCDSVEIETFSHYPQLGVSRWPPKCAVITLLSAGVFMLYLTNPPVTAILFSALALAISFFGLLVVFFQYLKAEQWSPKIFRYYKPKESRNVVGVIKPTGEVKKRVVYGGHIDSAHRFNLLQYFHEGYIYFVIGIVVSIFNFPIMQVRTLLVSIFGASGQALAILFNWLAILIPIGIGVGYYITMVISAKLLSEKGQAKVFWGAITKVSPQTAILLAVIIAYQVIVSILFFNFIMINPEAWKTAILVLLNYVPFLAGGIFFVSRKGVPGAMDNLSACAIATCVAKILNDWKKDYPDRFPKNTEVVIALFGSEESGCNGAQAFAEKHVEDYNKIDTTCVNMDTIADPEIIMVINRESSVRIDFDPETVKLLAECAEELKINHVVRDQPWATGGSDASGLIKGGLRASSLIGLHIGHYLYYYHTNRDDTVLINRERRPCTDYGDDWNNRNMRCALENGLKICVRYLEKKDKE